MLVTPTPTSQARGRRRPATRSRWAAIGAAVAVTIGSGGLLTTSASTSSGERNVFIPIPPCRLIDTRAGADNVGGRTSPIGPGEAMVVAVRGTNGNCTIPGDAVGVSMNVAIVNPSAPSYLTVYPADAPRPLAANLNWVANQAPTPNAVTARLSADGKVAFYNLAGTVDIAADVNGYYVDHDHDDRYYTKAELEGGPTDIGVLERMSDAQLAMQRWDLDPGRNGAVPALSAQGELAFDGDHVWALQGASNAIIEIDPRTNSVVTTLVDPALQYPYDAVFDGANLWVSNFGGGSVSRIDPATATVTGTFPVGVDPMGMAFDGQNIWVILQGVAPGHVAKVSAANGSLLDIVAVGNNPRDIVFDGRYLWVANANSGTMSKIDPTNDSVVVTASILSSSPYLLAYDGQYVWVKEFASLTRLDATGTYAGTAITADAGPTGLGYDGTSIWITTNSGLQRVDRLTGAITTIDPSGSGDMVFDGTNLWYMARLPNRVVKITP